MGPSNPGDVGIENVKKIIEQGIHEVCSGFKLREVSVFVGFAGSTSGNSKQKIVKNLKVTTFVKV